MARTFYVENLGCAKNQVDAETIIARLGEAGWACRDEPDGAELILVNTCGFIEAAKRESLDTVFELRARFPAKKIILAGCLAQRYGGELLAGMPEISGVFGNRDLDRVVEAAQAAADGGRILLIPEASVAGTGREARRTRRLSLPGAAYLKIGEGCANRCTYCAIPLIRGDLRSRAVEAVVEEARGLLDSGVLELTLIGQDIGSFGLDRGRAELAELLRALGRLDGRFWVRLLYIHPDHFPREILPVLAGDPRFLPYFDLPFQHAAPSILTAMGRRPDAAANLHLIEELRAALPGAVVRSTFLVGFPGESEADFEALLDFQAAARLDWLGVFAYSAEEGTPAYRLDRRLRVPKRAAAVRKRELERRQEPITAARLDRFVGREMEVLLEEAVAGEPLCLARGPAHAPEVDGLVVVRGDGLAPPARRTVKIIRRNGVDLEALA